MPGTRRAATRRSTRNCPTTTRRRPILIFGKGTEHGTRPLLPPGVCWICDQSPIQEEYRVIDTHRNARPGGPQVHESVRKYICEPCAREMGAAMGMVDGDEHAVVVENRDHLSDQLIQAYRDLDDARASQTRVVIADEIADVVSETVRAELAKARPKPVKTSVTVKGDAGNIGDALAKAS